MKNDSINFVFSDQLIEHVHPADISYHVSIVYGVLKLSGKYIFRTPHMPYLAPIMLSLSFRYS